jgi:hypothetical protein
MNTNLAQPSYTPKYNKHLQPGFRLDRHSYHSMLPLAQRTLTASTLPTAFLETLHNRSFHFGAIPSVNGYLLDVSHNKNLIYRWCPAILILRGEQNTPPSAHHPQEAIHLASQESSPSLFSVTSPVKPAASINEDASESDDTTTTSPIPEEVDAKFLQLSITEIHLTSS